MRRWLAYLLIWTLGSVATVGACWLGLRSVLDAAVPQRAAPFSAAELARAAPAAPNGAEATTDPSVGPVPTHAAGPTSTGTSTTPMAGESTTTTTTSPPPEPGSTAVPELLPGFQPSTSVSPSSPSEWEAVANGRGGTAYRRTFHVQGGDLTFWCDQFDVHVMNSVVRPGYAIVPTRYDVRSLLISLLSAQHASRVYVAWRNGPYAEITETVA